MEPPRFAIADCPSDDVARLRDELDVSGALAQVLVRRGMSDPLRARAFLAADERHAPSAFVGIGRAVAAVLEHVDAGARVTIHGDYDVDGVCSTALLLRALRALGADVDHYLPDRASDGYGLSAATVRRLAQRGTRLLVTADCAITAIAEVALACELGIGVVVTDHHAPRADGALPDAPIVHPAVCGYPCPELCATAVAYKLAQALYEAVGRDPRELEQELDLVALATIADVVPLRGENRALVRRGLRTLGATRKPGLRALMRAARVAPARIDERAVAFALAPRLNAAGRLYRADASLELLLTEDPSRAGQVAEELDRANYERREVEQRIHREADAQIAQLGERHAYVLAGDGWHPGVIGIVAARLAERHRRPTVLIALEGERGRGSARSIPAFDLLAGLDACAEHLLRHGGHRAAAGLELERGAIGALATALDEHAARVLAPADFAGVEHVDAIVGGDELSMALAEELQTLAPFGRGNPNVSLMLADATLADSRPMGEGKHVRFTVHSRGARARAVAFGAGASLPVAEGEPVQATFKLEINEWNGVSEPRLVLRHARPGASSVQLEPAIEAARLTHASGEREPIRERVEPAREDARVGREERAPIEENGELVLFAAL
jgi:single-stranded-DNA-specific exonuclease